MKNFTAKFIKTNLKKGWSEENFAEYFEISVEEFVNRMRKTFQRRAVEEMLLTMKKNQKKLRRTTTEVKIEKTEVNEMAESKKVSAAVSVVTTIDDLKKKEAEVSERLCAEENQHKQLVAKRRGLYDRLRQYKEILRKMEDMLQESMNAVQEINKNISDVTAEMETTNTIKAGIKADLEKIRADIAVLSKVTIFVYEDGSLEMDGEAEIPDAWNELSKELTANEELEILTVRQIKQLAKLIVLTKDFETRGVKYDIVFGSEIVQQLFEIFK